jgi:quercetin dioxygenase-like cupin family protein
LNRRARVCEPPNQSPGYGSSLRREKLMPNRRILTPALVLGIAMLASTSVLGAATQERIVAESRFTVANAPAQAALVQLVVDFPPGAWTSVHTHGGQAINLVLEGEITLRHGSHDRPHKAGQAWTDDADVVHAAGNTGSGNSRLLTNFLLPEGAPQITEIEASRFGPTVLYQARFPLPPLPAATEIVQQIVDLPPGGRAARAYDGLVAGLVVDGEVTIGEKKYTAGESWFVQDGTPLAQENRSATNARVFMTYLKAANR